MPEATIGVNGVRDEQSFIDSSLIWEKFIGRDLDIFWDARIYNILTATLDTRVKTGDYWTQTARGVGTITAPANQSLGIYSRKTFSYGLAQFKTAFPNQVAGSERIWVGFEGGAGSTGGIAAFDIRPNGMFLNAGGGVPAYQLAPDITAFAPADYRTTKHHYAIKVNKSNNEFYIDGVLRCIVLQACPELTVTPIVSGPYYIYGNQWVPFTEMTAFIESYNSDAASRVFALSPDCVRVISGDPLPPRVYRLYDAGTTNLFAGLVIAAGLETTHPVPTLGYPSKTFHFRANQNGDIDIEILMETGNWRIYAPDATGHTEGTYVANTLYSFIMTGDAPLVRITFTPDLFPCTIAEAECVIR